MQANRADAEERFTRHVQRGRLGHWQVRKIRRLRLCLPPLQELQDKGGRLESAQSESAEKGGRLDLSPEQLRPAPLRRRVLFGVGEAHACQLQDGQVAGGAFGQVAQVLDEFPELGNGNKVFVRPDEQLFGGSIIDIRFCLQFLLVPADQVGDLHLEVGQEDEREKGPAMFA